MFYRSIRMAGIASLLFVGADFAQAKPLQGVFITESGNLEVQIAPCGDSLCGNVARVLGNKSMADPDAKMAGAPASVGMSILTGLRASGDKWKGRIFNRENGKTYECNVRLLESGDIEVRPYVILPLFGKTQIWRRTDAGAIKQR